MSRANAESTITYSCPDYTHQENNQGHKNQFPRFSEDPVSNANTYRDQNFSAIWWNSVVSFVSWCALIKCQDLRKEAKRKEKERKRKEKGKGQEKEQDRNRKAKGKGKEKEEKRKRKGKGKVKGKKKEKEWKAREEKVAVWCISCLW